MPSPFFFQNILTRKPPFIDRYSFVFDGVNEYINIDNVLINSLATTTKGTWSAWVRPVDGTPAATEVFFGFGDTIGTSSVITIYSRITTGLLEAFIRQNTTVKWVLQTNAGAFSDNTWTHIALVQDGVSPVLYINGVAVAQTFTNSTDKTWWFNNDANLDNGRIACNNLGGAGNATFFNGLMDEVGFFNTNLSAAQILEIYNSGKPKNLLVHSASTNLVFYFRMGDGDTFDGTNWTLYDKKGSNNGTSANMENGDLSTIVP